MLRVRHEYAEDSRLKIQSSVWKRLLENPNGQIRETDSIFNRKIAILNGTSHVRPAKVYKILNVLPQIKQIVKTHEQLADPEIQEKIISLMNTVFFKPGDVLYLLPKREIRIFTAENKVSRQSTRSHYFESVSSIETSLFTFEQMMFNNCVQFKYHHGTSFSNYVFQNLMNNLPDISVPDLQFNPTWQAKTANIINFVNFDDETVKEMFYSNNVTYNGMSLDTSFVPKYDVRSLQSTRIFKPRPFDTEMLRYRALLNPKLVTRVPKEYLSIFTTFPFVANHYVDSFNGEITYLDILPPRPEETKLFITKACSLGGIESTLYDNLNLNVDAAVAVAAHATQLHHQANALLVLRNLLQSDVLQIRNRRIRLPTVNEIISWISLNCESEKLLLPVYHFTRTINEKIELIRNIAQSCVSSIGCAFLCSGFHLVAIETRAVFDRLTSDTERYVFCTLLLQSFDLPHVRRYRDSLKDLQFGTLVETDMTRYRRKTNRTIRTKEKLILVNDVVIQNAYCNLQKRICLDLYEFTNPKLAAFVNDDYYKLEDEDLAMLISTYV
jgi:hypothetical protein